MILNSAKRAVQAVRSSGAGQPEAGEALGSVLNNRPLKVGRAAAGSALTGRSSSEVAVTGCVLSQQQFLV